MPKSSGRRDTVRLVQELSEPLAAGLSLELVDVEYVREGGRNVLRLTIDRPGGVTHDDCQAISNALSDRLDELDPIPEAYYLEVSSPGIERPVKKDEDFARFAGREAAVHLFAPQDGKKVWTGLLKGLEAGNVMLETEQGMKAFPREQVSLVHLTFKF